jgi:hypothetical protein
MLPASHCVLAGTVRMKPADSFVRCGSRRLRLGKAPKWPWVKKRYGRKGRPVVSDVPLARRPVV